MWFGFTIIVSGPGRIPIGTGKKKIHVMLFDMRNHVIGISDQVVLKPLRLKPACSATETSKNNGIFYTANKNGADKLVQMHRQVCAIVIHIQQIQFSDSLVTKCKKVKANLFGISLIVSGQGINRYWDINYM